MNTNSLRRSLLAGTVALMVGVGLLFVFGKLFPRAVGLQIENRGAGHNHVALTHVTNTTQSED
jgi:hypothetical protein